MESTGFQNLRSWYWFCNLVGSTALVIARLELKVPHLLDYVFQTGLLSGRGLQDDLGRYHYRFFFTSA